jgi:hypothetical protein
MQDNGGGFDSDSEENTDGRDSRPDTPLADSEEESDGNFQVCPGTAEAPPLPFAGGPDRRRRQSPPPGKRRRGSLSPGGKGDGGGPPGGGGEPWDGPGSSGGGPSIFAARQKHAAQV